MAVSPKLRRNVRHRTRAGTQQLELSRAGPVLLMPDGITLGEPASPLEEASMHAIIYLVGVIVVIMFILSFLGLR
jgi:hypothetical protein